MEDNKRDLDAMNNQPNKDDLNRDNEHEQSRSDWEKKDNSQSYYYSYGPYKLQEPESASEESEQSSVEVSPPRVVKPLDMAPNRVQSSGQWSANNPPKKRSRVLSTFATIMATVLVTGGLMFGADRYDIFTDNAQTVAPASLSASTQATNTSTNNSTNVALDTVRPNNIADIVQNSSPAVVKIETYATQKSQSQGGNSLYDDPFFRQFFGDDSNSEPQSQSTEPQATGMGSGFIFEKSGYILTNQHVVEGADSIKVYVEGKDEPYVAELLGNSSDLDLAVLKIKGDAAFPTLPLASEIESLNVGDWVVAIGNPYGMDHTVTVGVLSAKGRSIDIQDGNTVRNYKNLLQTDASINPGNSGGPLLNLNGEVIGINTAINSEAQGIGYVVPISTINEVVDKLKNNVEIPKEPVPYVGVNLENIPQEYVSELGLKNTNGAFITSVVMGSPAFKAGVKAYDVILGINGTSLKDSNALVEAVKKLKVGDTATLDIMRDSKKIQLKVTIGDSTKIKVPTKQ
ncbi:MAG: trypsin-like peptidase domain-containing protein [Gorillibacterium sp.]|nr:trypsin-like peptidase domain-containing protein [Gorillibacterium sp.]